MLLRLLNLLVYKMILTQVSAVVWEHYGEYLYHVSNDVTRLTYHDALLQCQGLLASLSSATSPGEHAFLVQLMNSDNLWIGLTLAPEFDNCDDCSRIFTSDDLTQKCLECRGKWRWQDGSPMLAGGALVLDRWLVGEPTGGQTCARLSTENGPDGYWKDVGCQERYGYFCKKVHPCRFVSCNGGQCMTANDGQDYVCQCQPQRTGVHCESQIPSTVPTQPVTETTTMSTYTTTVTTTTAVTYPSSQTVNNTTISMTETTSTTSTAVTLISVTVILVSVVLLLGIFITTCCFYSYRAKRKKYEVERSRLQLQTICLQTIDWRVMAHRQSSSFLDNDSGLSTVRSSIPFKIPDAVLKEGVLPSEYAVPIISSTSHDSKVNIQIPLDYVDNCNNVHGSRVHKAASNKVTVQNVNPDHECFCLPSSVSSTPNKSKKLHVNSVTRLESVAPDTPNFSTFGKSSGTSIQDQIQRATSAESSLSGTPNIRVKSTEHQCDTKTTKRIPNIVGQTYENTSPLHAKNNVCTNSNGTTPYAVSARALENAPRNSSDNGTHVPLKVSARALENAPRNSSDNGTHVPLKVSARALENAPRNSSDNGTHVPLKVSARALENAPRNSSDNGTHVPLKVSARALENAPRNSSNNGTHVPLKVSLDYEANDETPNDDLNSSFESLESVIGAFDDIFRTNPTASFTNSLASVHNTASDTNKGKVQSKLDESFKSQLEGCLKGQNIPLPNNHFKAKSEDNHSIGSMSSLDKLSSASFDMYENTSTRGPKATGKRKIFYTLDH